MTDADTMAVDLLVELFRWDNSLEARWSAFRILCQARGLPYPSFDDFKVTHSLSEPDP